MNEFSAIYYPYATIDDLALLKRAIFTFDKLYLIYPTMERDSYKGLRLSRDKRESQPTFIDEGTHDLVASGFVEIIEPARTIEKFAQLMVQCYEDDLRDPNFLKIGEDSSWFLYREKVPETILDPEFMVSMRPEKVVEMRAEKAGPIAKKDKFEIHGDEVRMPLANAASIMISHAVFNSIEKNLVPITNDPVYHNFLQRRLQRGLKFLNLPTYKHYIGVDKKARLNQLMAIQDKFVTMVIPDASQLVDLTSLNTILNFRDDNRNLLRKYRQGMAEMAFYVQKHLTDPNFDEEMIRIVEDRIRPVYDEFRIVGAGLQKFSFDTRGTKIDTTAIGASSLTVIGGKPIPSAAISSKVTETSFEVAKSLLTNENALNSDNLNYLLHY